MNWGLAALGLLVLAGGAAGVVAAAPSSVADGVSWLTAMRNAVAAELPQLHASARALVVAHAAYESGYGKGRAAVRGFNVFNITAGSAWTGASWTDAGGDTNGAGARIDQVWRIYPSLQAAVRDYWTFLGPTANRGRYVVARAALESGDLPGFVAALSAAGYFELDRTRYAAGLNAVLLATR